MRLFFERQIVGMAITSPQKGWLKVNDRLCQMLGYPREELFRLSWAEITHPDDLATDVAQFERVLAGEIDEYSMEKRFIRKDHSVVDADLSVGCVRRPDGAVDYILALLADITDRKLNQQRLEHALVEQKAMLENELVGILKITNRVIIWANPAFEKMFGYASGEIEGMRTIGFYPSEESYLAFGKAAYSVLNAGDIFRRQIEYLRKDGQTIWVDVNGSALSTDPAASLWACVDVTERVRSTKALTELARTDPLTELANRRTFTEAIEVEFIRSKRFASDTALLMIDIDHFKEINDRHGHEAGDLALVALAKTLKSIARATDLVARYGGEEFVLLLIGTDLSGAVDMAERIREAVAQIEVTSSSGEFGITVSIGVAPVLNEDEEWSDAVRRSDRAMYRAKNLGRNKVIASTKLDREDLVGAENHFGQGI